MLIPGAGFRSRLVTIQKTPSETPPDSESGWPTEAWTTLANVQMEKDDATHLRGESFGASQLSVGLVTTWRMPYRADMDPDLIDVPKVRRLRYEGRIYDITLAIVVGHKAGLELTTLAKVG